MHSFGYDLSDGGGGGPTTQIPCVLCFSNRFDIKLMATHIQTIVIENLIIQMDDYGPWLFSILQCTYSTRYVQCALCSFVVFAHFNLCNGNFIKSN